MVTSSRLGISAEAIVVVALKFTYFTAGVCQIFAPRVEGCDERALTHTLYSHAPRNTRDTGAETAPSRETRDTKLCCV